MDGEARTTWMLLLGVGLSVAVLELLTGWIPPYGLFHDELYYWAVESRTTWVTASIITACP